MKLPNDPMILLSYINPQLRDFYPNLEDLCKSLGVEQQGIIDKLGMIDYKYNTELNKFI